MAYLGNAWELGEPLVLYKLLILPMTCLILACVDLYIMVWNLQQEESASYYSVASRLKFIMAGTPAARVIINRYNNGYFQIDMIEFSLLKHY
jgi:hypothetical protein